MMLYTQKYHTDWNHDLLSSPGSRDGKEPNHLKCPCNQILDIHFFTFSYPIGLTIFYYYFLLLLFIIIIIIIIIIITIATITMTITITIITIIIIIIIIIECSKKELERAKI